MSVHFLAALGAYLGLIAHFEFGAAVSAEIRHRTVARVTFMTYHRLFGDFELSAATRTVFGAQRVAVAATRTYIVAVSAHRHLLISPLSAIGTKQIVFFVDMFASGTRPILHSVGSLPSKL